MNRAAHQHGVLESFILRHSSPKILTKPPARIFAAYRFLFMICHVLGTPLDQQITTNQQTTKNLHTTPQNQSYHSKSYQHLQISRSPSHPAN